MSYKKQNRLQAKNSNLPTSPTHPTRVFIDDFTAADLKQALLPGLQLCSPLDELIASGEAAFTFIQDTPMDAQHKQAFYQLQKQFDFYKQLLKLKH